MAVRVGPPGVHPPRTGVRKEERRVTGGGTAWLWAPGRSRQGVSPPLALHLGLFPASGDSAGTEGGLLVEAQSAPSMLGASGNPGGSPAGCVPGPSVSPALGIEWCWSGRGAGLAMPLPGSPEGGQLSPGAWCHLAGNRVRKRASGGLLVSAVDIRWSWVSSCCPHSSPGVSGRLGSQKRQVPAGNGLNPIQRVCQNDLSHGGTGQDP